MSPVSAPAARDGVLHEGRLGGIDPAALAARFGTPLFAYDLDVVGRRVEALRAALPAAFELAYAVKANPNLAVLRHLARLGLGADVASGGELRHVLRAGFESSRVVVTGPGKRDDELRAAVEAGVRAVTVESIGELRRLAAIAGSLRRRQAVLLRVAVSEGAAAGRVRLVGDDGAGTFGMDPGDLPAAAAEAVASPWLEPLGLHAFGASNVVDASALADHVDRTVEAAIGIAAAAGFELRLVDAGGGLGIAYEDGGEELDLGLLASRLDAVARRLAEASPGRAARVLLEPGRYLVGTAGAYVARVVDRKTVGGHEVVVLDGGIHHVLRPVLVGQPHRVRVLTGSAARTTAGPGQVSEALPGPHSGSRPGPLPLTIAGPLCTGLDVFARGLAMAAPEVGDLVAVLDVGAYGSTESMPYFLSHPLPAEIAIRAGEAWVARPRIEPEAWLAWQVGEPPAG